jgi:hypothetical protein
MIAAESLEDQRLRIQHDLDLARPRGERNRLGQFATPGELAMEIVALARILLRGEGAIRFLDPAFGTGSFYSALLQSFPENRIETAVGYEIDAYYGNPAAGLWKGTPLELALEDFTQAKPPAKESDKANLIICNPPYVRHHHLGAEYKRRLREASSRSSAIELNSLAGLYCHFISLAHAWMAQDALALWLVPSEFMDVNYGAPLKEYLLNRVTLLGIHRFDPEAVQFDDALVSSAVVSFRNRPPKPDHAVEFTFGGSLLKAAITKSVLRSALLPKAKWSGVVFGFEEKKNGTKLSDLFVIKRGIATGANNFFILPESKVQELELPILFTKPILPSPRHLRTDRVESDNAGNPLLDNRLFLLNCQVPEDVVQEKYPALWRYLQTGIREGVAGRYLSQHRSPWYSQEERDPAPLLCTYMGRTGKDKGAFRFILNHSRAIAANVYLMLYPKAPLARLLQQEPSLLGLVWEALQAIPGEALTRVGRVYGGGLHKLEPNELAEAPADTVLSVLPKGFARTGRQLAMSW